MIDARWREARRVLLVRLDNLGDVLLMTPAIRAVRRSLPTATLTLLTSPVGAQVGHLNPDLDQVLIYEAPWADPWCRLPHDSERELRIIATLRQSRFDGAIIFSSFRQSPLPAAYLCYLADIPLRVAASIDGPGSLLTTRHRHPDRLLHEVERALDLVGSIGVQASDLDLVLQVPDEARSAISALLAERGLNDGRLLIAVHPGCSMPARTYPWELYAEVVELLTAQLGPWVVLTGSIEERRLVSRIVDRLSPSARAATLSLAGELAFPELCALVEAADLLITNNTGPMHVAAAVKTPVVALFALTNPPEQWGPWRVPHRLLYHEVPCRICYSRVCPYGHECLRLVSPARVVEEASTLLDEVAASRGQHQPPLLTRTEGSRG